jgi:hypothetical protein
VHAAPLLIFILTGLFTGSCRDFHALFFSSAFLIFATADFFSREIYFQYLNIFQAARDAAVNAIDPLSTDYKGGVRRAIDNVRKDFKEFMGGRLKEVCTGMHFFFFNF